MSDREVTLRTGLSAAHLLGAGVGALLALVWHSFSAGISLQETYATKKYVDDQAKAVHDQAFDHSDRNHEDMDKKMGTIRAELMLSMGSQSGDLKIQGVKIDQVLKEMTELKEQVRSNKK